MWWCNNPHAHLLESCPPFAFQPPATDHSSKWRPLSAALRLKTQRSSPFRSLNPPESKSCAVGRQESSASEGWPERWKRMTLPSSSAAIRVTHGCMFSSEECRASVSMIFGFSWQRVTGRGPKAKVAIENSESQNVTGDFHSLSRVTCCMCFGFSHSASRFAKGEHFHRASERHWMKDWTWAWCPQDYISSSAQWKRDIAALVGCWSPFRSFWERPRVLKNRFTEPSIILNRWNTRIRRLTALEGLLRTSMNHKIMIIVDDKKEKIFSMLMTIMTLIIYNGNNAQHSQLYQWNITIITMIS